MWILATADVCLLRLPLGLASVALPARLTRLQKCGGEPGGSNLDRVNGQRTSFRSKQKQSKMKNPTVSVKIRLSIELAGRCSNRRSPNSRGGERGSMFKQHVGSLALIQAARSATASFLSTGIGGCCLVTSSLYAGAAVVSRRERPAPLKLFQGPFGSV